MTLYFSPSTKGFYNDAVHGAPTIEEDGATVPNPNTKIPTDAVEITDEEYDTLMEATLSGHTLNVTSDGKVTSSPYTMSSLEVLAAVRAKRDTLLTNCDWTQVADVALTDDQIADWKAYRTALRNLPSTLPQGVTLEDVTWPTPPSASATNTDSTTTGS